MEAMQYVLPDMIRAIIGAFIILIIIRILLYSLVHHVTMVGGSDFINMFDVQRTLYIAGRKGGGKTLLSFVTAAYMYAEGKVKYIHSNLPSVISEPASVPLSDCCFIIDECQDFMSNAKDAKAAEAFIRKLRIRFILAGVGAPHRSFTKLQAWRIINGYKYLLPLWVYRWKWVGIDEKEDGFFILLRPDLAWFFYDTETIPPDDGGLFDALNQTVEMHKEIERQLIAEDTKELLTDDGNTIESTARHTQGGNETQGSHYAQDPRGNGETESLETIADAIADSTEAFTDSAAKIEAASEKLRKALGNRRRH